jgi:hypothetical protein
MGRLRDYIKAGQAGRLREDAAKEREPLPAGKYKLELVNGVLVESADDDVLELEWRVESGDHAGRRIYQRLKLAGPALAYSVVDLDLVGVQIESLDSRKLPKLSADPSRQGQRFRAPVPVGVVVGALIGHWSGTDSRARHRVHRLVRVLRPAPDLSEFEPEPPATATTAQPDPDQGGDEDQDDDWDREGGSDDDVPF